MRSLHTRLALGVRLVLPGACALLACQGSSPPPAAVSPDAIGERGEAGAETRGASPGSSPAEAAGAGATLAEPASAAPQLLRLSRTSAATHAERDHFLYLPAGYELEPSRRWPVIVFLHGDGSRGDAKGELDYVMRNGPLYEAWVQKRELPFIIIAPQLPTFGRESSVDYLKTRTRADIPVRLEAGVPDRPTETATPEPMAGAVGEPLPDGATGYGPEKGWPELETDVLAILDDVLTTRRGDPSRVYLTGLSYGGFGTWYLGSKHPERFAALVPIVGYGHPELMPAIASAGVPVWCFAGGRDASVRVKNFYAGLNRLEALGARELRFTIEEDMGHDVWARVYAGRDVYDWMLAHTRPQAAAGAKAGPSPSAPR
jgi:dienelactone hydrolase